MNILNIKLINNYYFRTQVRNKYLQSCTVKQKFKKDILNDNIATICLCDNFEIKK